eukprot:Phypoly_transcript_09573.p2 GENE.Phypoly_transcript_09573~~Phypoly_transcript_09573.p2  ORF type:complete len:121 (+),score=22.53 Phypoly_transcript_09573:171-533(+)
MPSSFDVALTLTDEERNALIAAITPKVQQLFDRAEDPNWKPFKKKDTFEVFYMKSDETPVIMIKSEGIIDATMEEAEEFFYDYQKLSSILDINYKQKKVLETIENGHSKDKNEQKNEQKK